MEGFHFRKATQALAHFSLRAGGHINYMKALKLIWLSDRLHLMSYGRTITGDAYYAMKLGPVAVGTKDLIKRNSSPEENAYLARFVSEPDEFVIRLVEQPDPDVFSRSDIKALDTIWDFYGKFGKYDLSKKSHNFP